MQISYIINQYEYHIPDYIITMFDKDLEIREVSILQVKGQGAKATGWH